MTRTTTASVETMPPQRGRFEGLCQILRFNYPMFLTAAAMLALGGTVLAKIPLPLWVAATLAITLAAGTFWTAATLAISHWVYDRAGLYAFAWLPPRLRTIRRWLNIHAGFDPVTTALRRALPTATGTAIDLFDPAIMTEPSIRRARGHYPPVPGTLPGRYDRLPAPDETTDAVLFIFAAHELRHRTERAALFAQAKRTLTPRGSVILVEHLRSPRLLLAFGPGAFHFHTRHEWLLAAKSAGLTAAEEFPLTPFARILIWRKQP